MEKKQDKAPASLRPRGVQASLRDGYRLFGLNFWRLVRASWLQAVIYALTFGLCAAYLLTTLLPLWLGGGPLTKPLLTWLGLLLLFLVAVTLFAFAAGVEPLRVHALTGKVGAARRGWGLWPWRTTWRGLTRLPQMLIAAVKQKRLGVIIAVLLVVWLVVLVATALLELPAIIVTIANVEGQLGIAAGDDVNLPDALFWINFGVFAFCGLLQAYIHLSTLFPLYYSKVVKEVKVVKVVKGR